MSARHKRVTGMNLSEVKQAVAEIQLVGLGNAPDAPNATCDRCGQGLRANPTLFALVKRGVADHGKCGGTWRAAAPREPK
jgi:hypothetical protein